MNNMPQQLQAAINSAVGGGEIEYITCQGLGYCKISCIINIVQSTRQEKYFDERVDMLLKELIFQEKSSLLWTIRYTHPLFL